MDSFEWFGGIGDQPYDSLKPPGDIQREIINTATMGLESFGGGGGGGGRDKPYKAMKKQQKIQDKANLKAWNYEWDQVQKGYNDTIVRNGLLRKQNEEALLYKEKTAEQSWKYQMGIREHQYNASVAAYNKAEKMYGAQVDYNQVAAQLATEAAASVRDERFDSVMYEGLEAYHGLRSKKSAIDTQQNKADLGMTTKATEADQQKQGLTLERQAKRAESAFAAQSMLTKSLQQQGQAKAKGQAGRSAAKTYQSMVADYGRASMQLADQVNRADSAYNLAIVGIDKSLDLARSDYYMTKKDMNTQKIFLDQGYALGEDQRKATKLSIGKAYGREVDKIKHDQYGANMRADAQRMGKPGMPPEIPKPLELPRTQILDPPIPVRPPKPLKGQGSPTPYKSSSGGMSTGGMIGTGLSAAGSVAMMIPGGQLAGGIMMGIGAITSMF